MADPPAPSTGRLTIGDLRGSAARRRREAILRTAFASAAMLSILISVLIIVSLVALRPLFEGDDSTA